jgi:hypothetical protein
MVIAGNADIVIGDVVNLDKKSKFIAAEYPFLLFCFHILDTSIKSYKEHHFNGIHSISFGNVSSCSGNL